MSQVNIPPGSAEEMTKTYRAALGLIKVLRAQLGITRCPFCENKEGNGHIHTENGIQLRYSSINK